MSKSIYSNEQEILIRKIKSARLDLGLTQSEASKLFKKSQSYISKVEAGQLQIDLLELKEFARIYKKDINYFI